MAQDLFHCHSPSKLREEIAKRVIEDKCSLPPRAKVFSAVTAMQEFDQWPTRIPPPDFNKLIADGYRELNRGIAGTRGVPGLFYAKELFSGTLYPGTQCAFGSGKNLSTTSPIPEGWKVPPEMFPSVSQTAIKYASGENGGVIVRCALKPTAKILGMDEIREIRRDNKNRAREAQLNDLGALTAALGFDGFLCDKLNPEQTETWYVIVNRTALIFQTIVLRFGPKHEQQQ